MTLSTLIAAALIVMGQQGAPLIGQKELPPPPAIAQQAAPLAQPPAQPQPVPPQTAPAAPAAEPQPAPSPEPQITQKDPATKRVAAFWVLLPGKTK